MCRSDDNEQPNEQSVTEKHQHEYRALLELKVDHLLELISHLGSVSVSLLDDLSNMKDYPDSALLYHRLKDASVVLMNCGSDNWKGQW